MGGNCTVYEDTYEIKPTEIVFPDDDNGDIKERDYDLMSASLVDVGEGLRWKRVVSPGKLLVETVGGLVGYVMAAQHV